MELMTSQRSRLRSRLVAKASSAGEDSGKCVCGVCVERLAAIGAWKRSKIFIRTHLKPFKVSTSEGSDYQVHAL
jgi:hypothetical protein